MDSMTRTRFRRAALLNVGMRGGLLLLCGAGATMAAAQSKRATAAAETPAANYETWDAYLGGGESAQYSSLAQINKGNVNQLKVAWTFDAGRGAPTFGPTVANGMIYVQANTNELVALDPATGAEKWRRKFEGMGSRGINYWQSADGADKRLIFIAAGNLHAVNADTGEPAPGYDATGIDLRVGLSGDYSAIKLQTNNPGRIFENSIIVSLPAGRNGNNYATSAADIHSYDIRTGKLQWVFHVIPQKGEFGADTWPEKDRDKFGGVHNWSEFTVDADEGVVYIPTGTARYDFYGGNRKGDNLFANSVLKLDARTGKRLWHYQTIHHDLWDFDLPLAPKLMTINKGGRRIPVVIQASKQGFLYVLNRKTGKPVWPIKEKKVPASDVPGEQASPTQPMPDWPKPFARQTFTEADINPYIPQADQEKVRNILRTYRNEGLYTPPSIRGSISMPGHNGGANWGMAAEDPVNGRFYVISRSLPVINKLSPDKRPEAATSMPNGGGDVTPYVAPVDFMLQSNGFSAIGPPWSTITAYNMNTGAILWQVPNGTVKPLKDQGVADTGAHIGRGAPVVTAGGLLFNASSTDRKFRARDSVTGQTVWEYDLPSASEGVPAVYQTGGREFIVLPVGGNGLWAPKLDMPAGPNQYVAFALPQGGAAGDR